MRSSSRWRRVCVSLAALGLVAVFPASLPASATGPTPAPCPKANPGTNESPALCLNDQVVALPTGVAGTGLINKINVIFPADYNTSSKSYPVLYLLHGAGDDYNTWERNTDIEHWVTANPVPFIVVMPDGGCTGCDPNSPVTEPSGHESGWYTNWFDGSRDYETYHISVLQAYVNSNYRTLSDDIAVAGLSMGGFGALSYAARQLDPVSHKSLFKVAASFSGADDLLYGAPISGQAYLALHGSDGTPDARVFGDQVANMDVWQAHNPASLPSQLSTTTLLLASGTGTPGVATVTSQAAISTLLGTPSVGDDPNNPGGYALETFIYQMNQSLVKSLASVGDLCTPSGPIIYAGQCKTWFYPGGYHGWLFWQADLHWALPLMHQILGDPR